MNPKIITVLGALLSAWLFAACVSPAVRIAGRTNEVRIVVLKDYIKSQSGDSPRETNIELYIVTAQNTEEAAVIEAHFKNNNPPVTCDTNRIGTTEQGIVTDRLTGVRAMEIWANVENLEFPEASVRAESHSSPTGGESVRYDLIYRGGTWTIRQKKVISMASIGTHAPTIAREVPFEFGR